MPEQLRPRGGRRSVRAGAPAPNAPRSAVWGFRQGHPGRQQASDPILVVHRSGETCRLIADVLASAGYWVEWITDAAAAGGRVAERRYALLVAEVDDDGRLVGAVTDALHLDPGLPLLHVGEVAADGGGTWSDVPHCRPDGRDVLWRTRALARPLHDGA